MNPPGELNDQDLGRAKLREIADGSITKKAWAFCPDCKSKVFADFPDNNAVVQAAKALLAGDTKDSYDPNQDPTTLNPEQRAELRTRVEALLNKHEATAAPEPPPPEAPIPFDVV